MLHSVERTVITTFFVLPPYCWWFSNALKLWTNIIVVVIILALCKLSHSVTTINDDLHRCCTQSSGGWRLAWGTSLEVAFLNRIWCYGIIEHKKYSLNRLHEAQYVGIVVIVFQNRWIQRSLRDLECRSAWGDQVIPKYMVVVWFWILCFASFIFQIIKILNILQLMFPKFLLQEMVLWCTK